MTSVKDFIENQAQVFLNPDSYGMIYLATNIHYENLAEIQQQKRQLKSFMLGRCIIVLGILLKLEMFYMENFTL